MLLVTFIILAFASVGTISFEVLLRTNMTLTRGSLGETTTQQMQSEWRLLFQEAVSIPRYPAGVTTLSHSAKVTSLDLTWQLRVFGLVQNPLNLTLGEVVKMPKDTVYAKLQCVDSRIPVAIGSWTGVRLAYLLKVAGVSQTAVKVAFHAADGYSTDLTVQDVSKDDVIIAYKFDGRPLKEGLRLIVPGRPGYKWISYLNGIELVDYDFQGKWEHYGYPD